MVQTGGRKLSMIWLLSLLILSPFLPSTIGVDDSKCVKYCGINCFALPGSEQEECGQAQEFLCECSHNVKKDDEEAEGRAARMGPNSHEDAVADCTVTDKGKQRSCTQSEYSFKVSIIICIVVTVISVLFCAGMGVLWLLTHLKDRKLRKQAGPIDPDDSLLKSPNNPPDSNPPAPLPPPSEPEPVQSDTTNV